MVEPNYNRNNRSTSTSNSVLTPLLADSVVDHGQNHQQLLQLTTTLNSTNNNRNTIHSNDDNTAIVIDNDQANNINSERTMSSSLIQRVTGGEGKEAAISSLIGTPSITNVDHDVESNNNNNYNHHRHQRSTSTIQQIISLLLSPILDETGSLKSILFGMMSLITIGMMIGIFLAPSTSSSSSNDNDNNTNQRSFHYYYKNYISNCIGYIYFLCWSVSFYPQLIRNYIRKTTIGLSVDFCILNVIGFLCYSIYNLCFYYNTTIQSMYHEKYGPNAIITVQSNDVAFAVHALVLSLLTLLQVIIYDGIYFGTSTSVSSTTTTTTTTTTATTTTNRRQPSTIIVIAIVLISMIAIVFPLIIVVLHWLADNDKNDNNYNEHNSTTNMNRNNGADDNDNIFLPILITTTTAAETTTATTTTTTIITSSTVYQYFNWLNYLYILSYMKIIISLIKYIPQVILNYQRKSTKGWSIWQIVLDFSGGILSTMQLILDCIIIIGNYKAITGNIAKFLLGFVSIGFDIIFMIQHYVLYNDNNSTNSTNAGTATDTIHNEDHHPLDPNNNNNSSNNSFITTASVITCDYINHPKPTNVEHVPLLQEQHKNNMDPEIVQ